jgi:hypothetical protein
MPSQPLPSPVWVHLQLSRDILKLACFRSRHYDGHFATLHQSGNHWIRHLLSYAIAKHYGLPPQAHIGDHSIIGEPKDPPKHKQIPQIVLSHRIVSSLVHNPLNRALFHFPRYVILVRDIRAVVVSHYERFKADYNVSFSEYLRGDLAGKRYSADVWDCIRFKNAWGRVRRRLPGQTAVLRYEDMRADVVSEAQRIWNFLGFPPAPRDLFVEAAQVSTKDKMTRKEDSSLKRPVVRLAEREPTDWYSAEDREFVTKILSRYVKYHFGYDYSRFEPARQVVEKKAA